MASVKRDGDRVIIFDSSVLSDCTPPPRCSIPPGGRRGETSSGTPSARGGVHEAEVSIQWFWQHDSVKQVKIGAYDK